MCSYNKLGGLVYAPRQQKIPDGGLTGEWGFVGLVMSGWGAVDDRVARPLAGLDLKCTSRAAPRCRDRRRRRNGTLDEQVSIRPVQRI
jgi:beta-glucosidase-like glycosyl hydrolase